MAATQDAAVLAHIADTVTAMAAQMEEQREVQQNVLAVLGCLLETSRAQSEMLADILGAATQEAGPSPVAEALTALVEQVRQLDENQTALIVHLTELPEAMGRQLEASMTEWSAAAGGTAT